MYAEGQLRHTGSRLITRGLGVVGVRRLQERVKPILLKDVLLGAFSTVECSVGVKDLREKEGMLEGGRKRGRGGRGCDGLRGFSTERHLKRREHELAKLVALPAQLNIINEQSKKD